MAFDKYKYINNYSKKNYKTLLLKYKRGSLVFDWLNTKDNKNGYILNLIEKDIKTNVYTLDKLLANTKKDKHNKELYFGDWLDEFYRSPDFVKQSMLSKEPKYNEKDHLFMCYVASAVEYLSNKYHLEKPKWVNDDKYIYNSTYYAFNTSNKDFQKHLKKLTPKEFAKRNLFVGDNVLKRV